MKPLIFAFSIVSSLGFCAPQTGLAQCPDWRTRPALHTDGSVMSSAVWDPDGGGALPPLLVLGGHFDRVNGAGGVLANNIAAWTGAGWQTLGTGITNGIESTYVRALAVFNGQLIAGGYFNNAGGVGANSIARWNGTAWQPLGSGMAVGAEPGSVSALTVFNGELIAGGRFTTAGGASATNVARWNGTSWQPLGSGVRFGASDYGVVQSLAIFNNELIAGGSFDTAGGTPANYIARWNGTTWQPLGQGVSLIGTVYVLAMTTFQNELIAAGFFDVAGGQPARKIARWNGTSWRPLAEGVSGDTFATVYALSTFNNELIAGGAFPQAGTATVNNIARWNGTAWSALAGGGPGTDAGVYELAPFNNELFVGGSFDTAGPLLVESLARWNGSNWLDIAGVVREPFGEVRALTSWNGGVVMGGYFSASAISPPQGYAGDIASWSGTTVNGFGAFLGGPSPVYINALATAPALSATELIVGGKFTGIGNAAANNIARRDNLLRDWEAMGSGFNADVNAVTYFNSSIVAAGAFTASGPSPLSHIARWNGTSWQPVGPGPVTGVDGTVYAMKGFSAPGFLVNLVVGGEFATAGGIAASRIATFSTSTVVSQQSWIAMGSGFNGPVYAIERFGGSTYAGGNFTASGTTAVSHIARWNGTAWVAVGSGANGPVRAMSISNGTLVVGGDFTIAGGLNSPHLARWNGTAWSALGGGTDAPVLALAPFLNEIHVGGSFQNVRNGVLHTPLWARFSEDGIPWFAQHPVSTTANCGANAAFTIQPALGYGGLAYQWRKDGTPINNGPTGTGSTIATNGTSFTIIDATPADAGTYDCVLSNGCGATTSAGATLTVNACQPCDLNCDGTTTTADAAALVSLLVSPGTMPCFNGAGDLNHDGALDALDIQVFLACLIP